VVFLLVDMNSCSLIICLSIIFSDFFFSFCKLNYIQHQQLQQHQHNIEWIAAVLTECAAGVGVPVSNTEWTVTSTSKSKSKTIRAKIWIKGSNTWIEMSNESTQINHTNTLIVIIIEVDVVIVISISISISISMP